MPRKKEKRTSRSWEEIIDDFHSMANMSCKPSRSKLPTNYVFDEDQTVRWNREQLVTHNAAVDGEIKDLNTKKNKWRDTLVDEIADKIVEDTGGRLTHEGAVGVFLYAHNKAHSYGVYQVFSEMRDLIDLMDKVLYHDTGGDKK